MRERNPRGRNPRGGDLPDKDRLRALIERVEGDAFLDETPSACGPVRGRHRLGKRLLPGDACGHRYGDEGEPAVFTRAVVCVLAGLLVAAGALRYLPAGDTVALTVLALAVVFVPVVAAAGATGPALGLMGVAAGAAGAFLLMPSMPTDAILGFAACFYSAYCLGAWDDEDEDGCRVFTERLPELVYITLIVCALFAFDGVMRGW